MAKKSERSLEIKDHWEKSQEENGKWQTHFINNYNQNGD